MNEGEAPDKRYLVINSEEEAPDKLHGIYHTMLKDESPTERTCGHSLSLLTESR